MNATTAHTLAQHLDRMTTALPPLPNGVDWLLPMQNDAETRRVFQLFLKKFYSDTQPRSLLLGINPGRFGSGVTNVSFTDPIRLETECGIPNTFPKRAELSSHFVYEVIHRFGGPERFYERFFIHSVVPFGLVKGGKNYNYYDEKNLEQSMLPLVDRHLQGLAEATQAAGKPCFCLGEGKNFNFLKKWNDRQQLFSEVVPLPHPRFIMQYRRRHVGEFVKKYLEALLRGEG